MYRSLGIESKGGLLAVEVLGNICYICNGLISLNLERSVINMVMTCINHINVKLVKERKKNVSHNDCVGLVDVLALGVSRSVHKNEFPVCVGLAHIVNKPVSLRLSHRIHIVGVENGEMSVAVVKGIVNAVHPVCVRLGVRIAEIEHRVENVDVQLVGDVSVVVACNGSDRGVHICKSKVVEIPVPLVVGVVIYEVAEIDNKFGVRESSKRTLQGLSRLSKVFIAACLNVGNGDEREFAVAVIGSECAVFAPKLERLVAYPVCIGGARLKV